jgi:phosphoenolpyruvate carboxykinase (GTP)
MLAPTTHSKLIDWVDEVARLTQPDEIIWCDGSRDEYERLEDQVLEAGLAIRINPELRPGSLLFRSREDDVARMESRTFIASRSEDDAGPSNNWKDPAELKKTMEGLYEGCMRGRPMYVIPFCMGPVGSEMSRIGVELTDSPYVVLNMHIMTRVGTEVLEALGDEGEFIPCLHSVGKPLAEGEKDEIWPSAPLEQKYISHFPEERLIWSYGSGYGGNALLGKKCLALRIASVIARDEGWLAEHMLILKITNPAGESKYVAAGFPSACGKTNLVMLVPTLPGWKIETIGDDITWMRFGEDGYLYAISPEAGFFGVAPGTSMESNPNAMLSLNRNSIFTNVALTDEGDVWWEEMSDDSPDHLIDWQGQDWHPGLSTPAAHPNARFTVPAAQCPVIAPEWENPQGVRISAILFGGRRPSTVPLIYEAFNWEHGVFVGSVVGSEVTAAVLDLEVGTVRRDPMAMLPFCGYHMGDYFRHWLQVGAAHDQSKLPRIFSVNWFRKDSQGRWLWPGYGENSRVLSWVFDRCNGVGEACETPIGYMPRLESFTRPADVSAADMEELLSVDRAAWRKEVAMIREHYQAFGAKMPTELLRQLDQLEERLEQS